MLTDQDALALIEKLRRTNSDRDTWALCEWAEWQIIANLTKPVPPPQECPACEKRKKAKTAAMKKWRKKGAPLKPDRYAG